MKINLPVRERDVERNQRPERILTQSSSVGTPSERRIKENLAALKKKGQANKAWLIDKRKGIEKAKALIFRMEKQLGR
jgi:hypothetical protein